MAVKVYKNTATFDQLIITVYTSIVMFIFPVDVFQVASVYSSVCSTRRSGIISAHNKNETSATSPEVSCLMNSFLQ
jgi:hypothetical protein